MYECCGRSFEAKGLRQHLDNSYAHSNEIECHWCFARWPTHDGELRLKHERNNHWYKCKECTLIFSTEGGLQEHVDEEHPPNYCYGCQRSFQSPQNLNQVVLHYTNSTLVILTRLSTAPQVINPCRKECQMSLVHKQVHQPDRRLSAPRVGELYIRYQPPENQPVLPGS